MKKNQLKEVMKSLMREINDENNKNTTEDTRSNNFEQEVTTLLSEIKKQLQILNGNIISETATPHRLPVKEQQTNDFSVHKEALSETRKRVLSSINADAYNGVNIFEDVAPILKEPNPTSPMANIDPADPGVDISGIMNIAGGAKNWNKLAKG
jgi:hypothetical protein